MSAFVCGSDHFKALAIFAASRHGHLGRRVDPRYVEGLVISPEHAPCGAENLPPRELAAIYANVLYAENVRSVGARYPEDTFESMPGPIDKPEQIHITARDETLAIYRLKPVEILKMCDCLEYQSCETDDWETTVACRLWNAIRRAAIRALSGYEDAPWNYIAPEIKRAA